MFLGILSIFQVLFLPGTLVHFIFLRNEPFLKNIPIILSISVTCNALFGFYAEKLNLFNTSTFISLIIFEIILLIILLAKSTNNEKYNFNINIKDFNFSGLLASFFILTTFIFFYSRTGNVFSAYDAIVSWNNWAQSWYLGTSPIKTEFYPQLLPINIAISNLICGHDTVNLQIFSYFIFLSFFPLSLLIIFKFYEYFDSLNVNLALIFSLIFLGWPFYKTIIHQIGYVDVPVMCLSFISLSYVIFSFYSSDKSIARKYIFLAIFVAAGAAFTKQAGIFIAIIVLFLSLYVSHQKSLFKNSLIKFFCIISIVYFLVFLLWYFEAYLNYLEGSNISLIKFHTNDIYSGKPFIERILDSFDSYKKEYFLILISVPVLLVKKYKFYSAIGLMYSFIWILFFTYSARNFLLAIPFLCISLSCYFLFFKKFDFKINKNFKFTININHLFYILIFFLSLLSFYFSDEDLLKKNFIERRSIMKLDISEAIYYGFENYGEKRIITTQNNLIARLPNIPHKTVIPYEFDDDSIVNINYFDQLILTNKNQFLLIDTTIRNMTPKKNINDKITNYIDQNVIELIFSKNDTKLYLIN